MKVLISGAVVAIVMLVVSGDVAKADHCRVYGGSSYGRSYSYQPSYSYRPSYSSYQSYSRPSYGYSQPSYGYNLGRSYSRPSYGLSYSRPGFSLSIGRTSVYGGGYSRSYGGHSGHHHRH